MSLFVDMVSSFVNGFGDAGGVQHLQRHVAGGHALPHVERCCKEVNWPIDERNGSEIVLYFNNPNLGKRELSIITGETGKIAVFSIPSAAVLPSRNVPKELMWYCLTRNAALGTGAWQMKESGNNVAFFVTYYALVEGMTAGMFKYICETLVAEVGTFDEKLRASGVL